MESKSEPTPEVRYKHHQMMYLGFAISDLGKAVVGRENSDIVREAETAVRNLEKFFGAIAPAPKLTELEGNFYHSAHVYMRKYMDTALATMLRRFVSDGKGSGVWCAFVQGAVANNFDYRDALDSAIEFQRKFDTPDNFYMRCLLEMWGEKEFEAMISLFRRDKWFEFPKKS